MTGLDILTSYSPLALEVCGTVQAPGPVAKEHANVGFRAFRCEQSPNDGGVKRILKSIIWICKSSNFNASNFTLNPLQKRSIKALWYRKTKEIKQTFRKGPLPSHSRRHGTLSRFLANSESMAFTWQRGDTWTISKVLRRFIDCGTLAKTKKTCRPYIYGQNMYVRIFTGRKIKNWKETCCTSWRSFWNVKLKCRLGDVCTCSLHNTAWLETEIVTSHTHGSLIEKT